jgi:hypothetical protein
MRLLLVLVFLTGALSESRAQTADRSAPTTPAPAETDEPDFLRTLPRPPDQPRSLLMPSPPPGPPPPSLDQPYFQHDPILDSPNLPPVGWYTDVQLTVLKPHLRNDLVGFVQVGTSSNHNINSDNTGFDPVALDAARLNWTVAPRIEVGYRLPSGFGELGVAYRFFNAQGTSPTVGNDGPATLTSRLDLNTVDFDYISREWSLWPHWDMKWRVGVRVASIYFDSRAGESVSLAAAGSGVFQQQVTDSWRGIGPHVGLELVRKFDHDWSAFLRSDFATMIGRQRQGFFETSSTTGADGQFLAGDTHVSGSVDNPVLQIQAGASWQPWTDVTLFLGYHFEYWWDAGRLNLEGSHGYFYDQGVLLQAMYDF